MNGSEWEAFRCSWSIQSSWEVTLSVNDRESEWQKSRNPPAIRHIRMNSCESSSHSSPCWVQEQRDPEHRPPRSHSFFRTFAKENHSHLTSAAERHCQRVGSSFKRRGINCTFYTLHYLWLCTCCWYPDDGVHVWNIWYLAFSRRHQMKCNSQIYLCFSQMSRQIRPVVLSPPPNREFDSSAKCGSFDRMIAHVSMPRVSVNKLNVTISTRYRFCSLFHWRQ